MLDQLPRRIRSKIDVEPNGCWLWIGAITHRRGGYGAAWDGRGMVGAHRLVWTLLVGPIPEGLDLDHTCHNADPTCTGACGHRRCVNPAHLEPVTPNINKNRARRALCGQGHPFTPENTYMGRPAPGGRLFGGREPR